MRNYIYLESLFYFALLYVMCKCCQSVLIQARCSFCIICTCVIGVMLGYVAATNILIVAWV